MRDITSYCGAVHRLAVDFYNQRADQTGLRGGLYSYLGYIYRHEGCRAEEIAACFRYEKSCVSRTLEKLEGAGLIRREADETDGRAQRIYPTEKAVSVRQTMMDNMAEWDRWVSAALSEEERAQLMALMEKVYRSAKEAVR